MFQEFPGDFFFLPESDPLSSPQKGVFKRRGSLHSQDCPVLCWTLEAVTLGQSRTLVSSFAHPYLTVWPGVLGFLSHSAWCGQESHCDPREYFQSSYELSGSLPLEGTSCPPPLSTALGVLWVLGSLQSGSFPSLVTDIRRLLSHACAFCYLG